MGTGALAARSTADPELQRQARRYITAMAQDDRRTLRELSPRKLENRFGPYPFVATPKLSNPRADGHKAAVDFTGRSADPDLPGRGILLLVRLDERTQDQWVVRGILWQGMASATARVPDRSVTAADRAREPKTLASAHKYLRAWRTGHYRTMDHLTYEWVKRDGGRSLPVKVRGVAMRYVLLPDDRVKVRFTAKLTVFGVLPRTVDGIFHGVRENSQWRFMTHQMMF